MPCSRGTLLFILTLPVLCEHSLHHWAEGKQAAGGVVASGKPAGGHPGADTVRLEKAATEGAGIYHEDYANAMVHLREAAGEMRKLWTVLDMRSKGEMRTVPLGLPEDEPAAPTAAELRQVCTLP